MQKVEITKEIAQKVIETVDCGLSSGLGEPIPGQMCVEAAVCYAMGMPHGDEPSCVGSAVRSFKIRLNDSRWSDNAARAKGMRRVAVAQLGSDTIDQQKFAKEVVLQTAKQILPIALRAAGEAIPAHKAALEAASVACEALTEFGQVFTVAKAARAAADAAADAAYAAAYAAEAAANAAEAAEKRNNILSMAAEIGVQALIKLGSKGVQWLYLCD